MDDRSIGGFARRNPGAGSRGRDLLWAPPCIGKDRGRRLASFRQGRANRLRFVGDAGALMEEGTSRSAVPRPPHRLASGAACRPPRGSVRSKRPGHDGRDWVRSVGAMSVRRDGHLSSGRMMWCRLAKELPYIIGSRGDRVPREAAYPRGSSGRACRDVPAVRGAGRPWGRSRSAGVACDPGALPESRGCPTDRRPGRNPTPAAGFNPGGRAADSIPTESQGEPRMLSTLLVLA